MADEGFHEIQLNGKQLVFLFITATVVAVVVFLCGVMVGRGVPLQRAGSLTESGLSGLDPTAATQPPPPAVGTARSGAPLSAQETLTYPERLGEPTPAVETLRRPVEAPVLAPVLAAVPSPAPKLPVEPPVSVATAAVSREATDSGFVVQVAAIRARGGADAIAHRLSAKGYPAFVTVPASDPRVFRVRVGKYDTRREAESVAGRLQEEERFKPWITR
jgi:cell division septation protein DedD